MVWQIQIYAILLWSFHLRNKSPSMSYSEKIFARWSERTQFLWNNQFAEWDIDRRCISSIRKIWIPMPCWTSSKWKQIHYFTTHKRQTSACHWVQVHVHVLLPEMNSNSSCQSWCLLGSYADAQRTWLSQLHLFFAHQRPISVYSHSWNGFCNSN